MDFLLSQSPLVIDLLVAGLILIFALIKSKIGLFHSIASVMIFILSVGGGLMGSKYLLGQFSSIVWEYLSPYLEGKIENLSINSLFSFTGLSFGDSLTETVDTYMKEQIESIAMLRAQLITEKVCSILLFVFCFLVTMLILNLIRHALKKYTEDSVLGWLNHTGGFVLGAVEAVIILTIIVRGAAFLHITTVSKLAEGTRILSWMEGGDFDAGLQAIKNLTIDDVKNFNLDSIKENIQSLDITK